MLTASKRPHEQPVRIFKGFLHQVSGVMREVQGWTAYLYPSACTAASNQVRFADCQAPCEQHVTLSKGVMQEVAVL